MTDDIAADGGEREIMDTDGTDSGTPDVRQRGTAVPDHEASSSVSGITLSKGAFLPNVPANRGADDMNGRLEQPPANATDDTNTIREELEARVHGLDCLSRARQECSCYMIRGRDALARVEARLAAPCHCAKCLDCLAADGYEAAIEHAEQARAEADRLREALSEIVSLHHLGHSECFSDAADDYAEIARAALADLQAEEQT